ncbi:6-hydroxymethylpterin diphosphokinase MptE-like protein [uncultured Paraglaciecola sp.]|uniref:motility associated factor glycosyltransferase family protein n=1 Tax=uncultured Paraglaciecola sp. TaxID=1765024 RepID=UPI002607D21F|nr:6-hydroxymethylpterin diphosphokinase MptE-like protein [uncultured Paraglaciecola sp.]
MLKNIRLHLDQDETKQEQIEQSVSVDIQSRYQNNLRAFRFHIPSVLPYIEHIKSQNISIFVNKFGQYNMVDYGVGRTFYGMHPEQEIEQQYIQQSLHCHYIDFNAGQLDSSSLPSQEQPKLAKLPAYQNKMATSALPTELDVLVVLGLAMGEHIKRLINEHKIKHLVIYEPEVQYFQCSVLVTDWAEVLAQAKQKGTLIYLQLNKDGRNLLSDINELREQVKVDGIFLYQHYHHPVFDSIHQAQLTRSWKQLNQDGLRYNMQQSSNDYLPHWTPSVDIEGLSDVEPRTDTRLQANLAAFEQYFPAIYQEFKEYQPHSWLPVKNAQGQVNVLKMDSMTPWHGDDPQQECQWNFETFSQQPNKDGLVLGYQGTKLQHYTHYRFVSQTEKLLNELEEAQGQLPEKIKSLIMFGIGMGYQIETLFAEHQVEKLFLCEPNRDFFYASLFAIDWANILQRVDESGGRIYINIGDDGSHLFRDLLNQFYAIGPYMLANTYFYQSYFNSALVQAVAQLREQLQIVIAMGEYYDHARYGIAHTTLGITRNYPLLTAKPYKQLSYANKQVPVFMVGNGPSLDASIETIKEWQNQAIVISCGTSLQVLYKNGIRPDFHAEIEQNRATFDWCCRVGDFDYLKQISLLSCNGIHPDTCELFKDVFVAFKEGESSTTSALKILDEKQFETLKFAFPTVSNFVINVISSMGFNQLYLMGIDLGFVDNKKHHSKQSGYYQEDGKEMYDYSAKNNTSIQVPGNFRKTVFTKHEFKVSKAIFEQSLAASKAECFNCSDGARIEGSIPLVFDNVLITTEPQEKSLAIEAIKRQAFNQANQNHDYQKRFNAKFKPERLDIELSMFIKRSAQEITNIEQAEGMIESQKSMLFASYQEGKSLLFYLLYGTVNYANAVFSKLLSSSADEQQSLEQFNLAREKWQDTLKVIYDDYIHSPETLDFSVSLALGREKVFIAEKLVSYELGYTCTGKKHNNFERWISWWLPNQSNCLPLDACKEMPSTIALFNNGHDAVQQLLDGQINWHDQLKVMILGQDNQALYELIQNKKLALISQVCLLDNLIVGVDDEAFFQGEKPYLFEDHMSTFLVRHINDMDKVAYFIPKLNFVGNLPSRHQFYWNKLTDIVGEVEEYIEYSTYLVIPRKEQDWRNILVDSLGNRGKRVKGTIKIASLIGSELSLAKAKSYLEIFKNE